jgi:hypothetical protein
MEATGGQSVNMERSRDIQASVGQVVSDDDTAGEVQSCSERYGNDEDGDSIVPKAITNIEGVRSSTTESA